jgi:hypothetical protein
MDPARRHHHHRDGGGSTASASVSSTSHSNPNNTSNNPTFKLNAPQATDDEVEDISGLQGGPDENIYATNQAMIDQYYESPEVMEYHQQQQQLQQQQQHQHHQQNVSTNRSVNSGGSGSNKNKKSNKTVDKMAAFNDMDEDEETQPEARQKALPLRCMIACGTVAIFLLVGLIVAVAVALSRRGPGGDGSSNNNNNNNNGVPTMPPVPGGPVPTFPPGTPTMPTDPTTPGGTPTTPTTPPSPTAPPATLDPKTTLGRIQAAGTLKCGVPVDQPGFALVNATTNRMEGFDADLCRAVAAAIFGTSEGHVEFQPLTAFERFPALAQGEVDMLARTTTHTMERSIKEVCLYLFVCLPCLCMVLYEFGAVSFHRRERDVPECTSSNKRLVSVAGVLCSPLVFFLCVCQSSSSLSRTLYSPILV